MEGSPASSSAASPSTSLAATSSASSSVQASPALATPLASPASVSPTFGHDTFTNYTPSPFSVSVGAQYPPHPPLLPLQAASPFPGQNSPFPFHPSPATSAGMVDHSPHSLGVHGLGKAVLKDDGTLHQVSVPFATSFFPGTSATLVQDPALASSVTGVASPVVPPTPPQTPPHAPSLSSSSILGSYYSHPSPPQSESPDVHEAPTVAVPKARKLGGGGRGGRGGGHNGASAQLNLAAAKFPPAHASAAPLQPPPQPVPAVPYSGVPSSSAPAQALVQEDSQQTVIPPYAQPDAPPGTKYNFFFTEVRTCWRREVS